MAIGWVIHLKNGETICKTRYFSERHHNDIIAIKEAIAIKIMLEQNENVFTNCHIIHYCDNMNVCYAYNNQGTSNKNINKYITDIYLKLHELRSTMNIYWVSTKCMSADHESRIIYRSEEFIPQLFFDDLQMIFNIKFTIDCMATFENKKCEKYFSMYPEKFSSHMGINFFNFANNINEHEVLYFFPPKNC